MASRKRRKSTHLFSAQNKLLLVAIGVVLAFVVLMNISANSEKPFLPTWDELFAYLSPAQKPLTDDWQMHVIDVGNADSILITDHTHSLLIDAGERGCGDTVLEYLEKEGITKLDYVIATHFHSDHIGGMTDVINGIPIGEFLLSYMPEDATPTTKVYENMLTALLEQDIAVREVEPGDDFTLGEASFEILGPIGKDSDINNQSIVCRVTCGDTRFLLMGDAEKPSEALLLDAYRDLSADVLKIGHHGSDTSSSREFLKAVDPTYSVMTCGEGNSYGHPHKLVLTLVEELGIKNYRCDQHGTVVFTTDGTNITVSTEK